MTSGELISRVLLLQLALSQVTGGQRDCSLKSEISFYFAILMFSRKILI